MSSNLAFLRYKQSFRGEPFRVPHFLVLESGYHVSLSSVTKRGRAMVFLCPSVTIPPPCSPKLKILPVVNSSTPLSPPPPQPPSSPAEPPRFPLRQPPLPSSPPPSNLKNSPSPNSTPPSNPKISLPTPSPKSIFNASMKSTPPAPN